MKRFTRKVMIFSLIFTLILPVFPSVAFGQAGYPTGISAKDISGNSMVYMKYDGDWDIYYYNVETGLEKKLTDAPGAQGYPSISGNYVVWQDNRNYIADNSPFFDIYLYDLNTGKEEKISQHIGYNQDAEISGSKVVWRDNYHSLSRIYVYDMNTKTETKITEGDSQAFGPQIYNDTVVWMDGRNPSFDIYAFDLSTETETQITSDESDQRDSMIIEGSIVWHDYREGTRQIYSYNMETGVEEKISTGDSDATIVLAENGKLVFHQEETKYIMIDTNTDETYEIKGVGLYNTVFINEDKIYWSDGNTITEKTANDVLIPISANPVPDRTKTTDDVAEEWTMINQAGGVVHSPDHEFSIVIPEKSTTGDLKIKVTPSDTDKDVPYKQLSKIYKIEKLGELKGKINIQYKALAPADDDFDLRRVLVYSKDNVGNWVLLNTKVTRNVDNLEIDASNLTSIAYSYYDNSPFLDIKNHWAKDNIEVLAAHQIINGYTENSFRPEQSISRAEFVKILVKAFDLQKIANQELSNFTDIENHWGSEFITIANQHGIIQGSNGQFHPDHKITREEIITIMVRALKLKEPHILTNTLTAYEDHHQVSDWAKPYVDYAISNDLIKGKSGLIAPLENATRAEAATVIARLLDSHQ